MRNKIFFSIILSLVILVVPQVSNASFDFTLIDSTQDYTAANNTATPIVAEDHFAYSYYGQTGGPTCNSVASGAGLSEGNNYWCLQTTVMGSLDLSCVFLCQSYGGPSGSSGGGSNGGVNTYIFSSAPVGTPIDSATYPYGCLSFSTFVGTGQSDYGCNLMFHGPAPSVTLSANPGSIYTGSSSLLTWSSTNTQSCTGSGFTVAGSATSGSVSVSPSSTTTYSITCSGLSGSATASATVTVSPSPAPSVVFSATPSSVPNGSSSTLSWSSSNASFCTGTGFDTGGATSGSISTSALSATTNYSITCTGTNGTPVAGTWQFLESDVSDLSCPVTDPNRVYSDVPNCPSTSPTGQLCSGSVSTCKVNTIEGCNINTNIYSCIGASTGTPPPSTTASATVTVTAAPISASCSVSPTSVYTGNPVTWTASASGGAGSYTYSWSGTDGLSGTSATISKTYINQGTKTASVTITEKSNFNLQGDKQCAGGTLVASTNDTQDGVAFGGNSGGYLASMCDDMTPAGGCCEIEVRESKNSAGQPINTYYFFRAYSGGNLVIKDSYTTGTSNTTTYHFFAGLKENPASIVTSCSNSVVVSVPTPDLTPGSLSPASVTAGASTTFNAGVTNAGTGATPVFGSTMYVCLASDSACLNNYLARSGSFWERILSFLFSFAEAGASIKIPLSRISITAGGSGTQTGSYTFPSPGSYQMRFCADTPLNEVSESNELDNCSAWTSLTVNPGPLAVSCGISPSSGYTGDTFTWTATPSGGAGSYTYSWSGTDGLSGTGMSVSKVYGSAGTKSASVAVTSGAQSISTACNTGTVRSSPTAVITVTPPTIVVGVTSPQVEWTSTDATSCTSTQFSTGGATAGSVVVSPTTTTTYTLTCTDGTRSAVSSAVAVVEPFGITLSISPNKTVRQGDPATVSWSVVGNPDSCLISGPGLSSTNLSGSQVVIINQESTYTLTCFSGVVSGSKSVTVGITPRFNEF